MKIAILTLDFDLRSAPLDDRTAFTLHWALLLRQHTGDSVTIFHASSPVVAAPELIPNGVQVVHIETPPAPAPTFPDVRARTLSAHIRERLHTFDIVYALDAHNLAFELLRERRFKRGSYPTVVTVLLDGTRLRASSAQRYYATLEQHATAFMERYSVAHSDFAAATSHFIVDYARKITDCTLPAETHVLGVPYRPVESIASLSTPPAFRHVIYYGRLDPESGLDYLIDGLRALYRQHRDTAERIESVVLLGSENPEQPRARHTLIKLSYGYGFTLKTTLTHEQALQYLIEQRQHALVIVPQTPGNTPYALMECAHIPDLHVIYPASGGILEMLESSAGAYLPDAPMLADKIAQAWHDPTHAAPPRRDAHAVNRRWLAFHERVREYHQRAVQAPAPLAAASVDVCIPYFNQPTFLPQVLRALERQTVQHFRVFVIDDGSTEPEARRVFDDMRATYAERGWIFERQANAFPGAARNHAARLGDADYLLFIDADDLAPPHFVARMLEAIHTSGDDSVIASTYRFQNDGYVIDDTGAMIAPPVMLYLPLGNDLIASQMDDVHGGPVLIIRRTVFDALGGYTEDKGIGYEDYELHVRVGLAGFRVDVLSETLHWYRQVDGGVSSSTNHYRNHMRVLRNYEARYDARGLYHLATSTQVSYAESKPLNEAIDYLNPLRLAMWRQRLGIDGDGSKRAPRFLGKARLNMLLIAPFFPYPLTSGGAIRVWNFIRAFGRHHDLTLISFYPIYMETIALPEVRRYLKSAYAVSHGEHPVPGMEAVTALVHERFSVDIVDIVRHIPTRMFDAAAFFQIHMSAYLAYIDTPYLMLDEQNIESDLAKQVASKAVEGPSVTENFQRASDADGLDAYERRLWRHFNIVSAVSQADKAVIEQRSGRSPHDTLLIDNGTDYTRMTPRARPDTDTVLFLGTLNYYPNIDAVFYFASEILPYLRRRHPTVKVLIAGRTPREDVIDVCRQHAMTLIDSPDSVPPVMWQSSATIVPLRYGGGTRLKILDSMALGVPVVSTTLGAAGLRGADGEHLLIRDDPLAFADAVHDVLSQRELWQKLSRSGRRLTVEHYNWDRLWSPLETRVRRDFGM
jgi:glycosyltransferase involved in cell wall biosynthesis